MVATAFGNAGVSLCSVIQNDKQSVEPRLLLLLTQLRVGVLIKRLVLTIVPRDIYYSSPMIVEGDEEYVAGHH